MGAIAIADGLKDLLWLSICRKCNKSANNYVGENGAIAIANDLKGLVHLYISKQRDY
jgi:hypothetical protein